MASSAQGWLTGEQGRAWFTGHWLLDCPRPVEGEPWGNFEDSGPRQLWTPEKRPAEDNNSQKLTFA